MKLSFLKIAFCIIPTFVNPTFSNTPHGWGVMLKYDCEYTYFISVFEIIVDSFFQGVSNDSRFQKGSPIQ